jgi:hypothetical protein
MRPSPCKRSILYRLRSADGRTPAASEPLSQGDHAFRPTCIAEPIRASVATKAGRAKGAICTRHFTIRDSGPP